MSTDSDIEIIDKIADSSTSANPDFCQLCSCNLGGLTAVEKDDHYKAHSGASRGTTRSRPSRKRSKPSAEKLASEGTSKRKTVSMKSGINAKSISRDDIFWHPSQAGLPPDNYTPGVLSILKEALKKSHTKGSTQRAVLCYERTPHIFREAFDASWGCTYRNFMMTCAALMDQRFQSIYFAHLDDPTAPGVRNLQQWIEDAWKHKYDDIGAKELNHKLVDTKQKIGTGELYVAFTFRKIPCELVDFNIKKSSKGFDALTDWIVDYFKEKQEGDVNKILRSATPVVSTSKMPVILQYQGHSVTIVGYELVKGDKVSLLVLDPSRKFPDNVRHAALNASVGGGLAQPSAVSPLGKGKGRERSTSPSPKKRLRPDEAFDDGVVSIPDSDDEKRYNARQEESSRNSTLDPEAIIKAFKLRRSSKGKHEYQLLYFTMGDPLSDEEQNHRKVVLSTAMC